jgi:3-dehydroquinate synthase
MWGADLLSIEGGEGCKTREKKGELEEEWARRKVDKRCVVIGVGGGALLDLVGFTAATFLRGVPLIYVPTTLVALVDGSIGGKNGVNAPWGKNQIGTIYFPDAVVADREAILPLSPAGRRDGLAEMWKMGLVWDERLLGVDESECLEAAAAKIEVLQHDPYEKGLRRILNFGHTVGHALEAVSGYGISHGEAVAIGAVTEAKLSVEKGLLASAEWEKIRQVYRRLPMGLPPSYRREAAIEAIGRDKKGAFRFVLLEKIGKAAPFGGAYCTEVRGEALERALDWMEGEFGALDH